MLLEGELFSGMKKAGDYLDLKPYRNKIEGKTGFRPFPGTLNLRVDEEEAERLKEHVEKRRIESFRFEGKVYSGLDIYKLEIEGLKAAFIDIDITDYDDSVMEIIAPVKLREQLDLDDGNTVKLEY